MKDEKLEMSEREQDVGERFLLAINTAAESFKAEGDEGHLSQVAENEPDTQLSAQEIVDADNAAKAAEIVDEGGDGDEYEPIGEKDIQAA